MWRCLFGCGLHVADRAVPRAPEVGRGERVLFRYGTIFSSLFGELVPGLVTLPVVEPLTRAVATWAGVAEVWFAR